jgi:hypothetical protein
VSSSTTTTSRYSSRHKSKNAGPAFRRTRASLALRRCLTAKCVTERHRNGDAASRFQRQEIARRRHGSVLRSRRYTHDVVLIEQVVDTHAEFGDAQERGLLDRFRNRFVILNRSMGTAW